MSAPAEASTVVIRVEGTFDLPAARLLESSLKQSAGRRVRVDFSRVRTFNDFAVAVLAHALKSPGNVDARVEGLRLHHVRLLRYFGLAPEVFRPEASPPRRAED